MFCLSNRLCNEGRSNQWHNLTNTLYAKIPLKCAELQNRFIVTYVTAKEIWSWHGEIKCVKYQNYQEQ